MSRFWMVLCLIGAAASRAQQYDVISRGGPLYDGTGAAPMTADVAIRGDRIVRVGKLDGARATLEVNATGLAVAPGFINMMSGEETLFADGRSESDFRQGVTLEVFGEGESMGPLTPEMQKYFQARQPDIRYPITWKTLAQGLDTLAHHGISCNVASFVGAATIRENVLGFADRAPTASELVQMQSLARQSMQDGLSASPPLLFMHLAFTHRQTSSSSWRKQSVHMAESIFRTCGVKETS